MSLIQRAYGMLPFGFYTSCQFLSLFPLAGSFHSLAVLNARHFIFRWCFVDPGKAQTGVVHHTVLLLFSPEASRVHLQ